jgi:hypothetical protein
MKIQCYFEELKHDPPLEQRIRSRYAVPIQQLEKSGYEFAWNVREIEIPLSLSYKLLTLVGIVIGWFKGEIMAVKFPFHGITYHPILFCRRDATYAYVSGLGVKLYTLFLDGTVLLSTNFVLGENMLSPENQYFRYEQEGAIVDCVKAHRKRIRDMEADGLQLPAECSFGDFVRLTQRELAVSYNDSPARKAADRKPAD